MSLALLFLLPLGAAADGQQLPVAEAAIAPPVEATVIDFGVIDTRLTVPVAVGSSGPYPFIIDTGAQRTVVSRDLAGLLKLKPGPRVSMTSMSEVSNVGTVIVKDLAIQSIGERHTVEAPALETRHLGAAGLLGIDTLGAHRVKIDFETGQMTVSPSVAQRSRKRSDPNEIVVVAKSLFGQLIVTDATVGTSRIRVVLDTGAQVTMGNNALRRKLRLRPRDTVPITLTSVTGGVIGADYGLVQGVRVGDIAFDLLPVAFADVEPFERFGLTDRPALLLGMDALRSFRHVEIDFPNRQVRFLMPRPPRRGFERHTSSLLRGVKGMSPSTSY